MALAGVPALIIALTGHNPLPKGGVYLLTFAWTAAAIAFAILREQHVLTLRVLLLPPVLLTALLTVLLVVRLAGSPGGSYGSQKVQLWLTSTVVEVAAAIYIGRRGRDFRIWLFVSAGVAAIAALVLTSRLASGQAQAVLGGGRYSLSSDYNPIEFGRTMAQGLIVAAFILLTEMSAALRLAALAVVAPLGVAFVSAGSRGPVLGLVLGLLVLLGLTLRDRERRRNLVLFVSGLVAVAVLTPQLVPGQGVSRALGILTGGSESLSSNGRYELFRQAWDSIGAHPIFGIGTGGFASIDPIERYPHDIVLEAWTELGVPGLLLVVGFLVAAIVYCARLWGRTSGATKLDVALVTALVAASIPNALVSGDLPANHFLWVAVGLAIGISLRAPSAAAEPLLARMRGRIGRLPAARGSALPTARRSASPAPQPAPPPGAIVYPTDGATVSGIVSVRVRPAGAGVALARVRLEQSTDGRQWEPADAVQEQGVEIVGVADGVRQQLAFVRRRSIAEALLQQLRGLDLHFDRFDMLPARELPWRFSDVTEVAWDTGSLAPGRYLLRAVTVVGAALAVPTEPVRVEVVAHEPAAPFPAPEAGRAAELEKAAAELAARESLLEERISVVSRREKALVRRYAQVEVTAPQPAAEAARPAEPPPPPPPPPEPPVARPEPAAPEPAPVPAIPPSPEPVRAAAGPAPGLWDLERLVAEHPDPDPYVQEERAALVYTLRAYASPDGLLPPEFHGLVEDAFGPLLG